MRGFKSERNMTGGNGPKNQESLSYPIFPKHVEAIHLAVSGLSPEEQVQATHLLKKLGLAAQEGFYRKP